MESELPTMQPTIKRKPRASPASAQASASVSPPVLSSLMLSTWYLPTRRSSEARSTKASSAANGTGSATPRKQSSSRGSQGCSSNATPRSARCGAWRCRSAAPQEVLASTISRARGASSWTMRTGSRPCPRSVLTFNTSNSAWARTAARNADSSMMPSVNAVGRGPGGDNPATCHAGRPRCLASRSHSAQSSALRAPPAGSRSCSAARDRPASSRSWTASICPRIEAMVSPA